MKTGRGNAKKLVFSITTLFFALIILALLGEVVCRVLLRDYLHFTIPLDERNLHYRYDKQLGWFPVEESQRRFTGSRTIQIQHNNRGFRDHEHQQKEKNRILFLGDSFVWGYDVEQSERFTEKLQKNIPEWEIINLGVSGYGTDQEYLLIQKQFDYYKPDIVFLIITFTDLEEDNLTNTSYGGGYYKPYFVKKGGNLKVAGIPIPKSINYYYAQHKELFRYSYFFRALMKVYYGFISPEKIRTADPTSELIKNIRQFVNKKGADFVVGFENSTVELVSFCQEEDIKYLMLGNPHVYPSHGFHWTPEGHTYVSEKIGKFLFDNDFFL